MRASQLIGGGESAPKTFAFRLPSVAQKRLCSCWQQHTIVTSSAGNSYIKARVRDWYRGQKGDWVGWGTGRETYLKFLHSVVVLSLLGSQFVKEAIDGVSKALMSSVVPVFLLSLQCIKHCQHSHYIRRQSSCMIYRRLGSSLDFPMSGISQWNSF